jgi:hypothetical protein
MSEEVFEHPDTIGKVEHNGIVYEVDWPFDLEDNEKHDSITAVLYVDGEQIADLPLPGLGIPFTNEEQVMEIAREYIKELEW